MGREVRYHRSRHKARPRHSSAANLSRELVPVRPGANANSRRMLTGGSASSLPHAIRMLTAPTSRRFVTLPVRFIRKPTSLGVS